MKPNLIQAQQKPTYSQTVVQVQADAGGKKKRRRKRSKGKRVKSYLSSSSEGEDDGMDDGADSDSSLSFEQQELELGKDFFFVDRAISDSDPRVAMQVNIDRLK